MSNILKFYPSNNKIYDPSLNRWVGLKEVAKRVHLGERIKVVNHDSQEDETGEVLAKIKKLVPLDNSEVNLIKKHKNRKMYSMNENKYISLQEICQKVKNKESFKVISYENKDITKEVIEASIAKYQSETK